MSLNKTAETVVAIHQPNFFPWLGYFDKIIRADIFIFMDNVPYPRTSRGTWINRVKFLIKGEPEWLTCPIKKAQENQLIKEILVDDDQPWRRKLMGTIEHSYGKCRFFPEIYPWFRGLLEEKHGSLAGFNMQVIKETCKILKLKPAKFVLGTTLNCTAHATDLLIEMTKTVGGSAYLCGGGASGYQEDEKFAPAGVRLLYQNFEHPAYEQKNSKEFVPGLSIFDVIFNIGPDETRKLLGRVV